MIVVSRKGVIAEKSVELFECNGVFNPATIRDADQIHVFYRAVDRNNRSSIGYFLMRDPLVVAHRNNEPLLIAEFDYESQGIEDPRITKIDGLFYLTYTAYDGVNALGALAVSRDLREFQKKGIIVPQINYNEFKSIAKLSLADTKRYQHFNEPWETIGSVCKAYLWDKNVMFFPRRINGKIYFLHRIKPDIQIVAIDQVDDLNEQFWHEYFRHFSDHILIAPKYEHEYCYVGGGCPPIETELGWLLIYHGVCKEEEGFVYSTCAALVNLENPLIEIARLPYPLFTPKSNWERTGIVDNVCFPTGTITIDDVLYIYYGAADERIACATVSLSSLLNELVNYKR